MVLQRKLDFGFNGYQMPEVPRASRSARGRRFIRQKQEGNQIHAFEILANVAGELLQESCDHSLVSSVCWENDEHYIVEDPYKDGSFDKKKTIYNEIGFQSHGYEKHSLTGSLLNANNKISFQTNSTSKDSNHSGMTSILSDNRNVNGVLERKLEAELTNREDTNIQDKNVHVTCCSDGLMKLDKVSPNLVCSVHDGKETLSQVVSRDNDEDSPGSVQSSTRTIAFKTQPDVENSSVKTPTTKNWEVSGDVKYGSYSKIAGKVKDFNQNEKDCYVDEKSQRIYPFKKRKFFNYEGMYDSPTKRINSKNRNSGIGASSLKSGLQGTKSTDCNVKLSIKSFRVPELFIEIPTTATIGLLKRTVMDAVTTVLGDGLHVGILCQGKKIRDDDKTLLQTGISQDVKHNSFSFVLEPKHVNTIPSSCTSNPFLPAVSKSQALNRHSTSLVLGRGTSNVSKRFPQKELDCSVGDDIGLISTPVDTSNEKPKSQALVAVPAVGMQPLAVVSYHRKFRHPEYVQRRIRRPFSVSEVEALVQAVEKIGTGRWRDVKLRAFDSAKHRTYVDLKDKWKTLVHTARISPQQRRGEPVPQELLDRVLAAQAYWFHRQSKQQTRSAA